MKNAFPEHVKSKKPKAGVSSKIPPSAWFIVFLACFSCAPAHREPVDAVNPYMGNISHLLVPAYPTIHLPNSLLRVCPNRADFTDDRLNGLPLIVTSHRGASAFNLSPFQGNEGDIRPVMRYSYDRETLSPYAYSVFLDEQGTGVEFAVSRQSALYEISFGRKDAAYLIVSSRNGELHWDGKAVSGYQTVAGGTKVFIHLEPEPDPVQAGAFLDGLFTGEKSAAGIDACLVLKFESAPAVLAVRYGISFIDCAQAEKNMRRETAGQDIRSLREKGRKAWNAALGGIAVSGGSEDDRSVFYTSLYRTLERPVCISEDGRYYSAFDGRVHDDHGTPFYTDDWLWDTYRAHHPLRVLIDPRKEEDILHSFVEMAGQMDRFWMPTFPEITGDSRRMNSNHGVASVLDAHVKGLKGFDLEKAYEACRAAVTEKTLAPWSGAPAGRLDDFFREHGYIPALREGQKETIPEVHPFEGRQPVAVTLGTAYDEWCLSQIALAVGKTGDSDYFLKRSYDYRNLFNRQTGFFHPKDDRGKFIEPFDYTFSGGQGARRYYGENNGWIYRWDVQHNIEDLIELMGGAPKFAAALDSMFSLPLGRSKYDFYSQLPDHTGNVGQFSMANEPSLHIPYLYNYAGQPWKTQKRVRALLREWFRNDLMGVPGDEDGGGMSAFVVFSSMGFYPVTPGLPMYVIGSPIFDRVRMDLGGGRVFEIRAINNSDENKYIQSATLNGLEWNRCWFSHRDIAQGGSLVLTMGKNANRNWAAAPESAPPSLRMKP
jgi:predicted alpha-1,2-mannosidase